MPTTRCCYYVNTDLCIEHLGAERVGGTCSRRSAVAILELKIIELRLRRPTWWTRHRLAKLTARLAAMRLVEA